MFPGLPKYAADSGFGSPDFNALREAVLRAYDIRNLYVSNNTAEPDTKIDLSCDLAEMVRSGGARAVAQAETPPAISLTIDMQASGANGLDAGTFAPGGYYLHLITSDDDDDALAGTVAAIASQSLANPAIPAGYTHKRVVSWGRAYDDDGTTKLNLFQHIGDHWLYMEAQSLLSSVSTATDLVWPRTELSVSGYVPAWADEGLFTIGLLLGTPPASIEVFDEDSEVSALYVAGSSGDSDMDYGWVVLNGQRIYYAVTTSAAGTSFWVQVNGFRFPLWREI